MEMEMFNCVDKFIGRSRTMKKLFMTSLVVVLLLGINVTAGTFMIENADDVTATWTVGASPAVSLTTVSGGAPGNARKLLANPSAGQATFTTTGVAGNRSAYMNGSIEFDYKSLGIDDTADGPYTPTAGYPRYLAVRISGGSDPANQWIEFNMRTFSNDSGLAWDVSSAWHTVKLAFVDGLGSLVGSEFDGAAATTASMSGVYNGGGMSTEAGRADMWANVSSIMIGNTYYVSEGPYVATALDNLRFSNSEPETLGILRIENADDVTAAWTLGVSPAYALITVSEGELGNARKLMGNPSAGYATFTTTNAVAGDRSEYMNGWVEFDYKSLGIAAAAEGPYTPTLGYPRYLAVRISGGSDPANQWIEFNVRTFSNDGGLAWDVSSAWHTVKLNFVDGLGSLAGSEFDGAAATTAFMSGVYNGGGMSTGAGRDDMWANVSSIMIGNTYYTGAGPYVATALDNLRLTRLPLGTLIMIK